MKFQMPFQKKKLSYCVWHIELLANCASAVQLSQNPEPIPNKHEQDLTVKLLILCFEQRRHARANGTKSRK